MKSFPNRVIFLLSVCLYLFLSECESKEGYDPAPICRRIECARYTVVHSQKDYEIRSYKDAFWVSSPKIKANSYKAAANQGFLILFDYINGNSRQHVKIDLAGPVLVDVAKSGYKVYFYVPKKYQKNIPTPLSPKIKPVKLPKHKYAAVRRFAGIANDISIPIEVADLRKSLQGTPYQRAAAVTQFTVAGYSAPSDRNRVNEVFFWFD